MTAITFPTDPANGELYTAPNGCVYIWDGEKWIVNSTIYTGPALENISQDRVAPMFVNGVNTGITFAYNATTNTLTSTVTDGDRLVNGAYTASLGANGVLTLPDGSIINGATLKTIAGNYAGITAGPASPAGKDEDSWVWVDNDGATISTKTSTDNHQWKFDNTGNLQLPVGGDIVDSNGDSVLNGGGNANTGNFTFKADRITNEDVASIVVGGGSPIENVVVDAVDELVPPGGVWRMFFLDADYLNLGTTVEVGDTVTTSWGTPITAAITDIVQDISVGTWALHFDQDITAEFNAGDTVTFDRGPEVLLIPTSKTWTFDNTGNLQLPVGGDIVDSTGTTVLGGGGSGDSIDNGIYSVGVGADGVVTMTTSRGILEFGALPECGGTTHFHIMKGPGQNGNDGMDLYFGDDYNYVLQRADSYQGSAAYGVEIGAQDLGGGGSQHVWRFNTDGDLYIPPGKTIRDSMTGDDLLNGSGTSIQSTTWVQDFETSLGATDVPLMATSVEYLANGDIVALFTHDVNSNSSTYSGVARFDSYGTKVWSMKFEGFDGDIYANGWGLAVDNVNGFIYVAGSKEAATGYEVATLTKLSEIDGDVVWSKSYDVGYNNSNMVVDVASDGNPVVVGYADNGTDNQVVTTKINADTGSVTWSRALNGLGDEEAYGMAVGPSGEVVSVGYMDTIIDYVGPVRTVLTLTATPASDPDWTTDILGVTFDGLTYDITFAGGVATFSNIVDDTGNRSVSDFAGNITGNQIGSGTTNMTVTVATTTMEDIANRILVVKYLSDGTIDWEAAVQVEAGYDCKGADADIDGSGNIYVCGNFDYDNVGNTDQAIIMFKFDSAGVKQWSRKVQGDCEDFAASIVVGPDNYLYLSAVTGTNTSDDYTMVIAKYNTDGTVVWQRLLDNTTTWTFGGGLFFNISGGSNLAVRDGYVAVSGSFGDPGTTPHAVVAQFDTMGTTFSVGDYDFIAASFSGVLDSAASNITVAGASKLDSDYIEEFTTSNFSPTVDLTSDLIGTLYSSTNGTVGTVKLISPGSRKIEEVYGYNSVSVTSRNFGSAVTSTAAVANTDNTQYIVISVSALELVDLLALVNGTTGYYFEVSLDQSSWRKASYGGYNNTPGTESFVFNLTNSSLPVSQGQTVYYRIVTGADPVVWWNAADLPNGDNNFRGATIDYHAYTGESTIIGTIHIVNDSGEDHISHSEVQSGSSDGENDDLWVVLNEGTVSYRRVDGESKTLKIQWTAKVFYGSEFYD